MIDRCAHMEYSTWNMQQEFFVMSLLSFNIAACQQYRDWVARALYGVNSS